MKAFLALAVLCMSSAALGDEAMSQARAVKWAQREDRDSMVEVTSMDAQLGAMVDKLLMFDRKSSPKTKDVVKAGLRHVDLKAAARRVASKVPSFVASVVNAGVAGKSGQPFAEESLQKARAVLNKLVEKAWKELDDKKINCWEFHDRNRRTFDQVTMDVSRLSQQIVDLERLKSETIEMINVKEREILSTTAALKAHQNQCQKIKLENEREMAIRKNDMAVFQFMMQLTKCQQTSFVQQGSGGQARICETEGGLVLDFEDKKAQAKLERMMTPSARQAVREMLEAMEMTTMASSSLLQGSKTAATTPAATTTVGFPTPSVKSMKVEVEKRMNPESGWYKCPKGVPDCGLLHDKMSLMWGEYKDKVDELQQTMDKNEFECEEEEENLNAQIELWRNAKARFTEQLNEATAGLASDREEMSEKQEEATGLEADYRAYMKKCKKRIEWIMFQDICAYLSLRATVMGYSKESPPEEIVDCEVADWVPSLCDVECDDECPNKNDPYACGGWQTIEREIVVKNNQWGLACPYLTTKRKCNQVKCKVDCAMSKWSSWGECSTDCNGGVRGRTRSVMIQADNGGMGCNTAQESQPCGSGCCNCECKLKRWSKWSPCSTACDGGFQERWKRVLVLQRGTGTCPKPDSAKRYRTKKCNTHECGGDEICIAKQDLIMSIDGSGSVQEYGFNVLKNFAAQLTDRYMGKYYGHEDMQIGVVQFGNGEVLADNTVSEAKTIIGLTSNMAEVKKAIEGITFQKGFTNMAQAFTVAERLLLLGGRGEAQSAVMTLTDGKPSFLFQTHEKVMQLKDKHVKLFFVPITEFQGNEYKLMQKWASQPWETNLVHVPGLEVLEADPEVYTQKLVVKFCPNAIRPEEGGGDSPISGDPWMLVYDGGLCGRMKKYNRLQRKGPSEAAHCSALTTGAGKKAFALGKRHARGRCYAMDLDVTTAMVAEFRAKIADPPCPGGRWKRSKLYDFYVNIPMA